MAEKLKPFELDDLKDKGLEKYKGWEKHRQYYLRGLKIGVGQNEHNGNRPKGCFLCKSETTTLEFR
jgi:hypothetical protein